MDPILVNPDVIILGAGFSAASTDGAMPLMKNYFDRLQQTDYPALYKFVSCSAQTVATANVERVLICLEQLQHSPDAAICGWGDKFKRDAKTIERELGDYTLTRLKSSLDVADDNWAAELLYRCGAGTTVVSLNYDNIAERVLSHRKGLTHWCSDDLWPKRLPKCAHCRMRLILSRACSCEGHFELEDEIWRGACVKLHGSIAWKRCVNGDCCSYQCIVADTHCQPFEPCQCEACDCNCSPVLVMPSMSKRLDETPEIHVMWKAAERCIADAETILIFGFSMPPSDQLFSQLIRSQVCATRKLKRVASIDILPENVLNEFRQCVPCDMDVQFTPFVVEPGKVPVWYSPLSVGIGA